MCDNVLVRRQLFLWSLSCFWCLSAGTDLSVCSPSSFHSCTRRSINPCNHSSIQGSIDTHVSSFLSRYMVICDWEAQCSDTSYFCQGGYVLACVCSFFCLSVSNITQKVIEGLLHVSRVITDI